MGQTALLPFRRDACWGFFCPWRLRTGLNPRTWVPKASTLPLDHRSRIRNVNMSSCAVSGTHGILSILFSVCEFYVTVVVLLYSTPAFPSLVDRRSLSHWGKKCLNPNKFVYVIMKRTVPKISNGNDKWMLHKAVRSGHHLAAHV